MGTNIVHTQAVILWMSDINLICISYCTWTNRRKKKVLGNVATNNIVGVLEIWPTRQ